MTTSRRPPLPDDGPPPDPPVYLVEVWQVCKACHNDAPRRDLCRCQKLAHPGYEPVLVPLADAITSAYLHRRPSPFIDPDDAPEEYGGPESVTVPCARCGGRNSATGLLSRGNRCWKCYEPILIEAD